jgi:hypothetical protein
VMVATRPVDFRKPRVELIVDRYRRQDLPVLPARTALATRTVRRGKLVEIWWASSLLQARGADPSKNNRVQSRS